MKVSEAVEARRSTRAFLDTPVPREVIVRVLERARRTPSGGNLQPWHAVVVGGQPLKALIARLEAEILAGESTPDYTIYPPNLPDPYRARRFGCAEEMYATMGIAREDKAARMAHVMRNYAAFDASLVLFCHTPNFMDKPQWSDLGMWLQTIMLLLKEEGVDTCPQEAWSVHGGTIRAELGIPEDHVLFCGISIGYADPAAPVNSAIISRAPLSEMVRFEGI